MLPVDFHPSYNIAPTHLAYVITANEPARLRAMHWGLVPHWSRDGVNNGKLINARAEGILEKPSFRESVIKRRCLVPADSFYEWRTAPGRRKIPYRILPENGALLFMAGIWDIWQRGDQEKQSFSIITTTPNRDLSALHDRMPVLLTTQDQCKSWLADNPVEQTLRLLHPAMDGYLTFYRVSEILNTPGVEGPILHEPVEEELKLF
jgi:putative SOS response-associated peptidase YedK